MSSISFGNHLSISSTQSNSFNVLIQAASNSNVQLLKNVFRSTDFTSAQLTDALTCACESIYGKNPVALKETLEFLLFMKANPNAYNSDESSTPFITLCSQIDGSTKQNSPAMIALQTLAPHATPEGANLASKFSGLNPMDVLLTPDDGVVNQDAKAILESVGATVSNIESNSTVSNSNSVNAQVPSFTVQSPSLLSQGKYAELDRACEEGNAERVTVLLKELNGKAKDQAKNQLSQALFTTCNAANSLGHKIIACLLLESGADANYVDENGMTPLGVLCGRTTPTEQYETPQIEILKKLFEYKANPNISNMTEMTPLELTFNRHAIAIILQNGGQVTEQYRNSVEVQLKVANQQQKTRVANNLSQILSLLDGKSEQFPTRLVISLNTASENVLFIRGDAPGMNQWNDLIPLRKEGENWIFETAEKFDTCQYKIYMKGPNMGEGIWEAGENHPLKYGQKGSITPSF